MGAAAAKMVVHTFNDLVAGRLRVGQQEAIGLENHAGRAKPALKGVVLDKGPLDGVKLSLQGKSFNRCDFSSRDGPYGHLTRGLRLVIHKNRAGATQPRAATKFRSGKAQIVPQNPQERPLAVDFDADGLVVEGELDGFDHFKPPMVEGVSSLTLQGALK
jgi:hypothetical protein